MKWWLFLPAFAFLPAAALGSDYELTCVGYTLTFDKAGIYGTTFDAKGQQIDQWPIVETIERDGATAVMDGNVGGFYIYAHLRPEVKVRYTNWGSTFRTDLCLLAGEATEDGKPTQAVP